MPPPTNSFGYRSQAPKDTTIIRVNPMDHTSTAQSPCPTTTLENPLLSTAQASLCKVSARSHTTRSWYQEGERNKWVHTDQKGEYTQGAEKADRMRASSNKPSRRGNRAGAAVQATKAIPTAKEIHRDAQDLGITDGITIEFRTQDVVDLSDKGVTETQLCFKREFTAGRQFRGKIGGDFRPRRITVGDKEITVVSVEVDSAMVNDFLTHFSAITFGLSGGRDVTWTATPHDKVSSATMILQYALASFFVNGQMDTYRKIRLRLTEGVIREETTNILDGFYDKVEHLYQQMEQWVLVATASGETMQTAMDETLHLDLADAEQELDGGNGRIQLHIAQRQAAYIKPTGRLAKAQTGEGGFIPVLMIKNLRRMAGEGCGFCRSPACDWRTCQAQEARNYRKAIIAVEEPLGNLQPANIRDTKP